MSSDLKKFSCKCQISECRENVENSYSFLCKNHLKIPRKISTSSLEPWNTHLYVFSEFGMSEVWILVANIVGMDICPQDVEEETWRFIREFNESRALRDFRMKETVQEFQDFVTRTPGSASMILDQISGNFDHIPIFQATLPENMMYPVRKIMLDFCRRQPRFIIKKPMNDECTNDTFVETHYSLTIIEQEMISHMWNVDVLHQMKL